MVGLMSEYKYHAYLDKGIDFDHVKKICYHGNDKEYLYMYLPNLEDISIKFYGKTTVVFWGDNTKTVVRQNDEDVYDKEKAIAMCFMKKFMGNTGKYNNVFKKFIDEEN